MSYAASTPTNEGAGKAPALDIKEDYDLNDIVRDYADITLRTQTFIDEVLIVIDRLMRKVADSANPYLKIGDLTPTQYTHSLIADFINKGVPYILSKGYSVNFPIAMNPSASVGNLAIASKLVRRTFDWNARGGRNTIKRRAKLIAARGAYATNYAYLAGKDKDEINDGYPVVSMLYDPLDVRYDRDALGVTRRVIVAKRRMVSELPPAWQGDHQPSEQVDVYEHFDRVSHGVVINGNEIVKDLTPHGYVDRMGRPMLPWIICLHDESEYVYGDSDPVSTGITPIKTLVGHPPSEQLIEATKHLSYLLTLLRFSATEAVLPTKEIKGQFIYDRGRRAYIFNEVNPDSGVQILDSAKNLGALLQVAQYFQSLGEQSGMGMNLLTGAAKEISGTSAQEQTDLVKSNLDEMKATLERGLAEEADMILAMVASNTEASTAQKFQARYGKPLPAANPEESHNYRNGNPMPLSQLVTGNSYDQITPLTFEGVDFCDVSVNAVGDLPLEQGYQIGMTLITNPNSPYDPVEVSERFFKWDNAQDSYNRGLLAKLMNNPQLPFGDLAALKALIQQKEGEIDETILEGLRNQVAQADQQAITNTVQQRLQAIMAGNNPGSSTPMGQPNGAPQGAIPPGQQAQAIGGMSPGAPPPVQPPVQPSVQMPMQSQPQMQG